MEKSHFERLKASYSSGKCRPIAYRRSQLKSLLRFLNECENEICDALFADLKKPRFESLTSEIGVLRAEIRNTLSNLDKWMSVKSVPTPITQFPATSTYAYEPKGLVLIISPWNFPVQLSIAPLIGAIAAGNTVILKPSEMAHHTSHLLATKLSQYIHPDCVQVIEGDHRTSEALMCLNFDHIFFTGSSAVGKMVLRDAAQNLVPVTLELGGKSPCVVDQSSNIKLAADRITWGKFINCGQVCIAPDYLLVHKTIFEPFVASLKSSIEAQYGENARNSPDYGRIISKAHTQRLQKLLSKQSIAYGGEVDIGNQFVAPTLVINPSPSSSLMQEEIFGPILPILAYDQFEETIKIISEAERPLAIYLFSKNPSHIEALRSQTASGAFCVNDTVSHVAVPGLPFGGIGASGMGAYHGEHSFQTFSYKRAYFKKSTIIDLPLRYAPYSALKERIASWFVR